MGRHQLFRSLRAHQYSSDQMKILKDQSAQLIYNDILYIIIYYVILYIYIYKYIYIYV